MSEEERRAAVFREQCENRARWRLEQAARLSGDSAVAARVKAGFAPLLPQSSDAWDCPEPAALPRPSWADRVPGDVELPEYLKRTP